MPPYRYAIAALLAAAAAAAAILAKGTAASGTLLQQQFQELAILAKGAASGTLFQQQFKDLDGQPKGATGWCCIEHIATQKVYQSYVHKKVWHCPANVAATIVMCNNKAKDGFASIPFARIKEWAESQPLRASIAFAWIKEWAESQPLRAVCGVFALTVLFGRLLRFIWRRPTSKASNTKQGNPLAAAVADNELFVAAFSPTKTSASGQPSSSFLKVSSSPLMDSLSKKKDTRRRSETPPPPAIPIDVPTGSPTELEPKDTTQAEACLLEIVNNGSLKDLQSVVGFGPKRASAVLKYRTENGPFGHVDDIENAGIGVSSAVIKKCLA